MPTISVLGYRGDSLQQQCSIQPGYRVEVCSGSAEGLWAACAVDRIHAIVCARADISVV